MWITVLVLVLFTVLIRAVISDRPQMPPEACRYRWFCYVGAVSVVQADSLAGLMCCAEHVTVCVWWSRLN